MDVPTGICRLVDLRGLRARHRNTDQGPAEIAVQQRLRRRGRRRRGGDLFLLQPAAGDSDGDHGAIQRWGFGIRSGDAGVGEAADLDSGQRGREGGGEAEVEGVEEDDDDDVYHGRSGEFPADGAAGDRSQIPRRKLAGSGAGAVEAGAAEAERQPRSAGTGVLAHSRHVGFSTRPPPHPPTTGLASLRRRLGGAAASRRRRVYARFRRLRLVFELSHSRVVESDVVY